MRIKCERSVLGLTFMLIRTLSDVLCVKLNLFITGDLYYYWQGLR